MRERAMHSKTPYVRVETLASGRGRLADACACLPFGSPTLNRLALPIVGSSGYSRLFPLEMSLVEGGHSLARSPMIAGHVRSREAKQYTHYGLAHRGTLIY